MLKYINYGVVFQEIPDETTLSINISNCPIHCPGCHSKYLWEDEGKVLDMQELDKLVGRYMDDITCVCFMGGDREPWQINALAQHIRQKYPHLKIGWYSGRDRTSIYVTDVNLDYVKLGPYKHKLGGLASKTTNQRLYRVAEHYLIDITYRLWK